MWYSADDPAERERRRWIKPNAYLWVRPDIHRFMRPDAERFFHPSHRSQKPWYEQPEYISPAMRAFAEKPTSAPAGDDAIARANVGAYAAERRGFTEDVERRARAEEADRQAFESELARLRRNNAALQALLDAQHNALALRRLARKAGFDPNQPRVPAGNPDGGQWTDGDGGSRLEEPVRLADARTHVGANVLSDAAPIAADRQVILAAGRGGIAKELINLSVREFVSRHCRGTINRELPREFEDLSIADVIDIAKGGDARARRCIKLLSRNRFRKGD